MASANLLPLSQDHQTPLSLSSSSFIPPVFNYRKPSLWFLHASFTALYQPPLAAVYWLCVAWNKMEAVQLLCSSTNPHLLHLRPLRSRHNPQLQLHHHQQPTSFLLPAPGPTLSEMKVWRVPEKVQELVAGAIPYLCIKLYP